jgi:hypothetical protein
MTGLRRAIVNQAFADVAKGSFDVGLAKLNDYPAWHDDRTDLDGPFRLAFPGADGWGEELFIASLLKRVMSSGRRVTVFAAIRPRRFCEVISPSMCKRPTARRRLDHPQRSSAEHSWATS